MNPQILGNYQLGFLLFLSPSRFRWIGPNSGYTQIHCRTIMFPFIYICIILPIKKTQPVHQLFDMILSCGWWMLVLPCPMKYERTYPPLIKWGTCSTSPTENHTKPWGCYMGTGQNLCTPGEPQYSWAGCSSENGVYRYWCMATSLCMIKYIPLTIMKTNQHPNLNHH